MTTLRKLAGVGITDGTTTCRCRSCYATSVGLTTEAVDNWRGPRRCRFRGLLWTDEHPAHGRQEDIDEYLDRYGYNSVEEWAEDSNYVLRDGKWYAQDGLVVDPATCLIESINELISRYE